MKRLVKVAVVATLALSAFAVGAPVSAQQASTETFEIGYTGPNSENQCVRTYTCSYNQSNETNIVITDDTQQTVASGNVSVNDNETAGASTSGTVSNDSGTVFNVVITNANPRNETDGFCTATVTVPATQPPVSVIPAGSGQVEELPKTSGDTTLQTFMGIVLVSVGAAALSVGAVLWYRNQKSL